MGVASSEVRKRSRPGVDRIGRSCLDLVWGRPRPSLWPPARIPRRAGRSNRFRAVASRIGRSDPPDGRRPVRNSPRTARLTIGRRRSKISHRHRLSAPPDGGRILQPGDVRNARVHHRRDRPDRPASGQASGRAGRPPGHPLATGRQGPAQSGDARASRSSRATPRSPAAGTRPSTAATRSSTSSATTCSPIAGPPRSSGRSATAGSTAPRTSWPPSPGRRAVPRSWSRPRRSAITAPTATRS